jgi:hypothetical protein
LIAYIHDRNNVIKYKISDCTDWYKNSNGNYELVDKKDHHYIIGSGSDFKVLSDSSTLKVSDTIGSSITDLRDNLKLTDIKILQNITASQSDTINELQSQSAVINSTLDDLLANILPSLSTTTTK